MHSTMLIERTLTESSELAGTLTPTSLERPSFLMCPPFALDTGVANNIWMEEYGEGERVLDRARATVQFLDLYNYLAAQSLVYLLPAPPTCGLQDQSFVANLAFIPEHLEHRETAIISQFTSQPRIGEEVYGRGFFEMMGYRVVDAPHRFEGEAEIKHLHDNVYIGGYGERTDRAVFDWMEREFDMQVIAVEQTDPYFYHLDCSIFPLTQEETIVATSLFTPAEVRAMERVTGIIDISKDDAFNGLTNSVRLRNLVLNSSNITEMKPSNRWYAGERDKNRTLEDICATRGLEPVYINVSEYFKSGALLSCMVMHLNRLSYYLPLH